MPNRRTVLELPLLALAALTSRRQGHRKEKSMNVVCHIRYEIDPSYQAMASTRLAGETRSLFAGPTITAG